MPEIDIEASIVAPDLEALRDEKTFPVVQTLLTEMGEGLVNTENNFVPIALKALSVMLDADLNVATEVSYVPQVILGVTAGLNRTLQECTVIEPDDGRYAIIANKILAIVASADITLGNVTAAQSIADFEPVKEELNALFEAEKLTRLELRYVTDTIFESFSAFNNLISNSITNATERMEVKILGIESMNDLTLKKLDAVLLPPVEEQANEPASGEAVK